MKGGGGWIYHNQLRSRWGPFGKGMSKYGQGKKRVSLSRGSGTDRTEKEKRIITSEYPKKGGVASKPRRGGKEKNHKSQNRGIRSKGEERASIEQGKEKRELIQRGGGGVIAVLKGNRRAVAWSLL